MKTKAAAGGRGELPTGAFNYCPDFHYAAFGNPVGDVQAGVLRFSFLILRVPLACLYPDPGHRTEAPDPADTVLIKLDTRHRSFLSLADTSLLTHGAETPQTLTTAVGGRAAGVCSMASSRGLA